MSKYIDTEKLIAEIRRIVEEETPISKGSDYYHGVADTADKLLSFITSLQQEQPEVDLEKEVSNYLKMHHLHIKDGGRVVFDNDDSPNFMFDIIDIARHFAKWGAINFKAGKEDRHG